MKVLAIISLLFSAAVVSAQNICDGSLGENIFTAGDFGSGSNHVLLSNPGIAPGYQYTTSVPPDGFYTITNNTALLAGLYPSWLRIGDNSGDPNGYMMLVNASFSPGVFYEEQVDGLCEGTLYEFSADIINMIAIGWLDHIEPRVQFLINGEVFYDTGDIAQDEKWKKVGFTFVTGPDQTSVTLTLRNSAPGGTGNDLALDNISFRPCGPSAFVGIDRDSTIFLCYDDDPINVIADVGGADGTDFVVQWQESSNGTDWQTIAGATNDTITHSNFDPGSYFYRYFSAANTTNLANEKCRVISDAIEIVVLPQIYALQDSFCNTSSYFFDGQELTEGGFYMGNFISSQGCDSLVELSLISLPDPGISAEITVTDPSCYSFADGSILADDITGGYGAYQVSYLQGNIEIPPNGLVEGQYFIQISDRYDCRLTEEIDLISPPEVSIEIGEDTTLNLGEILLLNANLSSSDLTINWSGNGDFDCQDCNPTNYLGFFSGIVVAEAIDDNGCNDIDSLFVEIDESTSISFSNVFSPNGDNFNDQMILASSSPSIRQISKVTILNRWGNLVFQAANLQPSGSILSIWDGYQGNQIAAAGVYVYLVEVELINGVSLVFNGDVTVVR